MRIALAFALAAFLLPTTLLAAPAKKGPGHDLPEYALARLKRAFARKDRGAEWATLSPGFKLRLSRKAGRNVDVGDYIAARNAHRNDPRIQELEEWIHTARATDIHYDGHGKARVSIWFGAPLLLGKSVTVTMIHHKLWRLWIKGEAQPYWGFDASKKIRVFRNVKTNVHTVQTLDARGKVTWTKSWPASKVLKYETLTRWYFHDFGNFEAEFMKAATGGDNKVPPVRRTRRPRARPTR